MRESRDFSNSERMDSTAARFSGTGFISCLASCLSLSRLRSFRHRNIQIRTKTDDPAVPELLKEHVVALRRNHVELIARRNLRLLKPLVEPLEVVRRVFVLLDVVGGRLDNFLVALDLDNKDLIALLDEKVGAKFPTLRRVPFLPSVFDPIEADRRVFEPSIELLRVLPSDKQAHEFPFGRGVGNDEVHRRLEVRCLGDLFTPAEWDKKAAALREKQAQDAATLPLANALSRIIAGERGLASLKEGLEGEPAVLVEAILRELLHVEGQ